MNLIPILEGRIPRVERTLFWRTRAGGRHQKAVRHGDWKLVLDGPQGFLFDVRLDPSERHDLARSRPDLARELKGRLDAWERDVDPPRER
jgi:arylsulfatase A-like enzyme